MNFIQYKFKAAASKKIASFSISLHDLDINSILCLFLGLPTGITIFSIAHLQVIFQSWLMVMQQLAFMLAFM